MSRYRKQAVAMKRGSFRDTIRKTVGLLTRDQVEVLFRGFQPCVITQGDKIIRMVLPEVGDDAPEELIEAMHGFLDHECGHIFYTPFGRAQQLGRGSSIKAALLNIVEDIRLEKLLPRDLPGTKDNLERMYERMIDKFWGEPIQKAIAAGTPPDRMLSVCIVVSFRALAGQKVFHKYMDDHGLWPFMTPLLTRYPDLGKDLSSLETYDDVVACVEKVLASLEPKQKQQMDDDAKAQQAAQQQDQDDQAPPQQSQQGGDDTDDESEDEGEGDPQDSDEDGDPEEGKGSGSDDSGEDDADNGDGDGEGSDAGDDEGNSSEGDDADEGEGGAGDESDEGEDGSAGGDGEGDDDSEDEADEKKSKGGKGHGDGEGEDDESDEEGGKCSGDADDANPDHDGDGKGDGADTDEVEDSDSSGGGKSNRTITDAVKSLDATSRRVLYLHKKKRRSIEKIATDMHMSEDEVKSILGAARRKLAEYMMGDK